MLGLPSARVQRANGYASRYGLSHTLVDRCVGIMLHDYDAPNGTVRAGMTRDVFARLAPRVCALGAKRHVLRSDGDMSEATGEALAVAAARELGWVRFRTLVNDGLAVRYGLAPSAARATRWDRCVAMGLAGYDAARLHGTHVGERGVWAGTIRKACTIGVELGMLGSDGDPTDAGMAQLVAAASLRP